MTPIIYISEGCSHCDLLLKLLKQQSIPHQAINIDQEPQAKSYVITRRNHTPVPQVEVNGRIIFDYTTEEELVKEIKELISR
jgi:glutaredoxin